MLAVMFFIPYVPIWSTIPRRGQPSIYERLSPVQILPVGGGTVATVDKPVFVACLRKPSRSFHSQGVSVMSGVWRLPI